MQSTANVVPSMSSTIVVSSGLWTTPNVLPRGNRTGAGAFTVTKDSGDNEIGIGRDGNVGNFRRRTAKFVAGTGVTVCHAHRFRDALRAKDSKASAVDVAAAPLIERHYEPLLRYCDMLAYGARQKLSLSGDDLAQEAWRKIIAYITKEGGDRVQDDVHFDRLLRRAAKTCLLDMIEQAERMMVLSLDTVMPGDESKQWAEHLADDAPTPEQLLFPKDSNYMRLIEMLFLQQDKFHRRFRQANQRHPRQYQALVMYQVALAYREAAMGQPPDEEQMKLISHFMNMHGVPAQKWDDIGQAARGEADARALPVEGLFLQTLAAVNLACGTQITQRKTLITYRAEMNRFARQMSLYREENPQLEGGV